MSNIITLADFEGQLSGFGQHTQQVVDELNKAMGTGTTGEAYGQFADGSAMRPESLEGTLKVVTATEKNIKLWKDINKLPAYNTVEEYNVLDSYGGNTSPFFTEGGLPEEEDSNYTRQAALVKFLGTTRVITHPMTLVNNTNGDIVARETRNGTLWLLQQLERSLFFANSTLNPLAFDGILRQIVTGGRAENVIDMKGLPLTEAVLEDGGNIILDNYGTPSKMYLTPKALTDLSKVTYTRQRGGFGGQNGVLGQSLKGFESNGGAFTFEPDVFLRPRGVAPLAGADGAPGVPVWDALAPLAAANSATGVGLPAGTYNYVITALNNKGESVGNAATSVAVKVDEQVTIVFDRVVAPVPARSYRIYRDNGDGVILFMREVADDNQAASMTIIDRNEDIPGTSTAFLLDLDAEQSMSFKQLAPLMKLPLARISAAERFMILLYGMPLVYNPRRNVVIKNIGAASDQVLRDLFTPTLAGGKTWDASRFV